MANPFDQFDAPATKKANPFDEFDAPAAPKATAAAPKDPKEGKGYGIPGIGGLVRAAAQGVTLGYADDIAAGIGSLINGRSYDENYNHLQGVIKDDKEKGGAAYTAAEIAGGLAVPGLGAVKTVGTAVKAAPVLARAAAGAATGGALGTANAYGSQEKKDGKEALKWGGGVGALAGGLTPAVGEGIKKVAPYVDDYLTRAREIRWGIKDSRSPQNALSPIRKATERNVVRKTASDLKNAGLETPAKMAAERARLSLDGTDNAFAINAGDRYQQTLIDAAGRIKRQPRGPGSNYVRDFSREQLAPGGRQQMDRLRDRLMDDASVPANQRDTGGVANSFNNVDADLKNRLTNLREAGGRTAVPGIKDTLTGSRAGRQILSKSLRATESAQGRARVTPADFEAATDRKFPVPLLMEARYWAGKTSATDPGAKNIVQAIENAISQTGASSRGQGVSRTIRGLRRNNQNRSQFNKGLETFKGGSVDRELALSDLPTVARSADLLGNRRLGALHGAKGVLEDNTKNAAKAKEILLETQDKKDIWGAVISPRRNNTAGAATPDGLSRQLDAIDKRQTFVNDLSKALKAADLEGDTVLTSALDTARRAQFSPSYAGAHFLERMARSQPAVRSEATLRMGLDPQYGLERKAYELLAKQRNGTLSEAYVQALIDQLGRTATGSAVSENK